MEKRRDYRFQPNIGAIVQPREKIHIPSIRSSAPVMVSGLPAKPLTITLYLSNAIMVIDHMELHPNKEPNIA